MHYGEFKFCNEDEQDIYGQFVTTLCTCEPESKIRAAPALPTSKKCVFKSKVEKKAMDEYFTKVIYYKFYLKSVLLNSNIYIFL